MIRTILVHSGLTILLARDRTAPLRDHCTRVSWRFPHRRRRIALFEAEEDDARTVDAGRFEHGRLLRARHPGSLALTAIWTKAEQGLDVLRRQER